MSEHLASWMVIGIVALVGLALLIRGTLSPGLDRLVDRARRSGDVGPLAASLLQVREGTRPDAFNHVIRRLWDDYERELALPLIRALVERHPSTPIAQYWLDHARRVEPELSRAVLDEAFVARHHDPHLAASCGEAG